MDNILDALLAGTVAVSFTKVDGTKRFMTCTLNPEYLSLEANLLETTENDHTNGVYRVWDIDKKGWRSFREDSVTSWHRL